MALGRLTQRFVLPYRFSETEVFTANKKLLS